MSMSTHVVGIRDPDDVWSRMKSVWDACTAMGVPVPAEVVRFFGEEDPDPAGITIPLDYGVLNIAREWGDETRQGLEITIAELPAKVTKIRFYNSW